MSTNTNTTILSLVVYLTVAAGLATAAESLPEAARTFVGNYCLDCHDDASQEGGLSLETDQVLGADRDSIKEWIKVFDMLRAGDMPPADADQPEAAERKAMLAWLDKTLSQHDRPGGTVLRRLNRTEYENSVRAALGVPFEAPNGFPADTELHGFNNIGEGLVLSPPLMQKYFEMAGSAADLVIPPERSDTIVKPETTELLAGDFTMNFQGSKLLGDVMRLVSKNNIVIRSCTWPTRFEARYTGTYTINARMTAFKPQGKDPLVVELLIVKPSVSFSDIKGIARAATLKIPADGKTHEVSAEFDLEKGQTVAFYWSNAPIGADANLDVHDAFVKNPKLHAAWKKIGGFDRGRTPELTWEALKKAMANDELDLSAPEIGDPPTEFRVLERNGMNRVLQTMNMEQGPALDIHAAKFHGPTVLKESREDRLQRARTAKFLGERGEQNDREYAKSILSPFLARAFRRPVTARQLHEYITIALNHRQAGHRFEDGIHLAVRAALCSPNFLYRGQRDGVMDDHDLANRLSYFLTSSAPDNQLRRLADSGKLSDPKQLEAATRRLLNDKRVQIFLDSFTGQWLDLDALPDIMPDERLIKWTANHRTAVADETRLFVAEILRENHPLEAFIDPDFTYLNRRVADLYGMKKLVEGDEMQRVSLQRGGRYGGILGQSSVMMATANGVDTQPVLRGVWLLENILGQPAPEPPTSVPGIEPDTSGAKTIRELLDRHKEDASCASCHKKIDPLGFALENFDPVGRWREFYPVYERGPDTRKSKTFFSKNGQPVDTDGQLTDGTPLNGVVDLKRYLVRNIDTFSSCLTGKLLTYATGRPPTFGDRKEVQRIVKEVKAKGNGFQDLIVAVVLSESFHRK